MNCKNQTCCFTGHRAIPSNVRETIEKRLKEEIVNLIHQGVKEFRAGGTAYTVKYAEKIGLRIINLAVLSF